KKFNRIYKKNIALSENIVCFGEMLWDIFPEGNIPGGAPMNAALHLRQLGAAVSLISRIGSDKEGKDLLDFIHGFGLSTDYIQIDPELPTGRVLVDESDSENRVYQIVKPVAWDQIEWTESQKDLVDH